MQCATQSPTNARRIPSKFFGYIPYEKLVVALFLLLDLSDIDVCKNYSCRKSSTNQRLFRAEFTNSIDTYAFKFTKLCHMNVKTFEFLAVNSFLAGNCMQITKLCDVVQLKVRSKQVSRMNDMNMMRSNINRALVAGTVEPKYGMCDLAEGHEVVDDDQMEINWYLL